MSGVERQACRAKGTDYLLREVKQRRKLEFYRQSSLLCREGVPSKKRKYAPNNLGVLYPTDPSRATCRVPSLALSVPPQLIEAN